MRILDRPDEAEQIVAKSWHSRRCLTDWLTDCVFNRLGGVIGYVTAFDRGDHLNGPLDRQYSTTPGLLSLIMEVAKLM